MLILIIIGLIYFVSSIKYIGILMLRPESTRLNSLRTSAEMSTLIRPPPLAPSQITALNGQY